MFLLFVAVLILFVWVARLHRRVAELEADLSWTPPGAATSRAAGPPSPPPPPPPPPPPTAPPPGADHEPVAPRTVPEPAAASPEDVPSPPLAPAAAPAEPVPPPTPMPPPPLTPAPAAVQSTPPPTPGIEWEALIGVRLFSWIAGIALALGGIFFLRYSIQSGWLQPPVRFGIGVVTGIAILAACETRWAGRVAITANALAAAGLVILFSSFYAAHALWSLIGALPAFAALVAVAAIAVLLSLRHDSLFIALLGLVGGFATPALLSSGEDRPFTLFGYLLMLNGGLGWIAYRRRWPALVALSLVFTTLYQWNWVLTFLSPERVGLALGVFTAFPLLAWGLFWWSDRTAPEGASDDDRFRAMAGASAALPLLFVLFLATEPTFSGRFPLIFGFLFVVCVSLYAIARTKGPRELHALGAVTTVLVFLQWWGVSAAPDGRWRVVLAFVALFVVFFVWAHRAARRAGRPFTGVTGRAVLAAALLFFMFPALAISEPAFGAPALPLAVLVGLMALVAAHAVSEDDGLSYFVAASLAVGWAVVWTGRYLGPETRLTALGADATLAVFFILAPLVARRVRRGPSPLDGFEWLALLPQALLLPLAARRTLAVPPWPLFAVAGIIQLGASSAALAFKRGGLHAGSLVVSALVLMVWTLDAGAALAFIAMSGAAILAGFALVWREVAGRVHHAAIGRFDTAALVTLVLAQFVLVIAAWLSGEPGTAVVSAFHLLLAAGLLALAARSDRLWIPLLGVLPAALGAATASVSPGGLPPWIEPIAIALPAYLLFLAYPILIAPRLGGSLGPHATAVLASAAFFLIARHQLELGGYDRLPGLLPLAQAGTMGILLAAEGRTQNVQNTTSWVRPLERRAGSRHAWRIALIVSALVAFVTIAVPVQFDRQWVTVGWGLQGVAMVWVSTRVRSRPLLWAAMGLLAVSVLKGFLFDMARLGGLYRVASFVGLAICLALAAVVLHRVVFGPHSKRD